MKKLIVYVLVLLMIPTIVLADNDGVEYERHILDKSSRQAFIDDVLETFGFTFIDEANALSSDFAQYYMESFDYVLGLFGVEFITTMNASFADSQWHGDNAYIIIRPARRGGQGIIGGMFNPTGRNRSPVITIYSLSASDRERIGVRAVLAHEIGHMISQLIFNLQWTGVNVTIPRHYEELSRMNGRFRYTDLGGGQTNAHNAWVEGRHGTTFATLKGLSHHWEDFASMFEVLGGGEDAVFQGITPGLDILTRLSNPDNDPLLQKMIWLRDLMYEYIGFTPLFAPIYEALEILEYNAGE